MTVRPSSLSSIVRVGRGSETESETERLLPTSLLLTWSMATSAKRRVYGGLTSGG